MRVSVFGVGYVGAVTSACLSALGHEVVAVDQARLKVELINAGKSPVIEKDLEKLIEQGVRANRLRATDDPRQAVFSTDLSLLCVGTPSKPNGALDTDSLATVCRQIGGALREKASWHSVVVRSTVLPGTGRNIVIPTLTAASGKQADFDFGIGSNPEFMREGTAVDDFYHPPKTVIGTAHPRVRCEIEEIYAPCPVIQTSLDVAEMIKYADNSWHALKVTFANEIAQLCKGLSIDSREVMNIFCSDTKLNLSASYLRPGFSFGGSCLPKDVRALAYKARSLDLDLPVLNAILPSNEKQTMRGLSAIINRGNKHVSVLGMSFKAGTDDLRESPILHIIEQLIGKGFKVRIFDHNVRISGLMGANKAYLLNMIPHVSSLLVDTIDEALAFGETIVVGNADPMFDNIVHRLAPHQHIVDFVGISRGEMQQDRYDGISW